MANMIYATSNFKYSGDTLMPLSGAMYFPLTFDACPWEAPLFMVRSTA